MTTNHQDIDAASDIDAVLAAIAEPYNRTIDDLLATYETASGEVRNAEENCQRFEKAAEASKVSAVAINLEIREALRSNEVGNKAAHKKRADRAGHLEDVEIYASMAQEAKVSCASSELKVRQAASSILHAVRRAQADAETVLTKHLTEHLAAYRPLMLFVGLIAERAGSGNSAHFDARPDIHSPMEFALTQLRTIVQGAFANGVPEAVQSRKFLRPIPPGLERKELTPLLTKRLETEIAAMAAAL